MEQQPDSVLAMREWIRGELLSKSESLPSLPNVVQQVLLMVNDPEAEAADFANVLRNDPALVAKMLAMANSPVTGISRRITSIRDAVMVVGFQKLSTLALTAGVTGHLAGDYGCYGFKEGGLWKHAVCVGTCAQVLGKAHGFEFQTREELFIAGLLHDIGKILLGPYLSRMETDSVGPTEEILALERDLLGIDHAEAAGFLAEKWDLGPLVTAVACHHDDSEVPVEIIGAMAVVRLADAFVHERQIGYWPNKCPPTPRSPIVSGVYGPGQREWHDFRDELENAMKLALHTLDMLNRGDEETEVEP